jgi:hypothetical protein
MINYEVLQQCTLLGLTETLEYDLKMDEFIGDSPGTFFISLDNENYVAEALYARAMGWTL